MKTLAFILFISTLSFSQIADSIIICSVAEEKPTIIGGIDSLYSNIIWPETSRQFEIEGKFYVLAYLDSLGNLDSAQVIKGLCSDFDEEALRVVKLAKFTPAHIIETYTVNNSSQKKSRKRAVSSTLGIPFIIRLK